jgi:hypothetical protein
LSENTDSNEADAEDDAKNVDVSDADSFFNLPEDAAGDDD